MKSCRTPKEQEFYLKITRILTCVENSMRNKKKRGITLLVTVDRNTLNEIYHRQDGKCYYTGAEMKITSHLKADPLQISLDRIDSTRGYTPDNVVLCCLGFNLLKNAHSGEIALNAIKTFYEEAKKLGKI